MNKNLLIGLVVLVGLVAAYMFTQKKEEKTVDEDTIILGSALS